MFAPESWISGRTPTNRVLVSCSPIRASVLGAIPYAESSASGHLRAGGRPCEIIDFGTAL